MNAAHTVFELLCYLCFIGALVTITGTVLYWLDNWLDGDIAAEAAEYTTDGAGRHRR